VVARLRGADLDSAQSRSVQGARQAGGSSAWPLDQYSTALTILPSATSKKEAA
jgi:hypothetical protein